MIIIFSVPDRLSDLFKAIQEGGRIQINKEFSRQVLLLLYDISLWFPPKQYLLC